MDRELQVANAWKQLNERRAADAFKLGEIYDRYDAWLKAHNDRLARERATSS